MTEAGQAVVDVVEVAAEAEAVVAIVAEMTVVLTDAIPTAHQNPEEVATGATLPGVTPTGVIVNGETVNPRPAGAHRTAVGDHLQIGGEIAHHPVVAETKEEIIFGVWTVIVIGIEAGMAVVEVVAVVAVAEVEVAEEADSEVVTAKIGGRMPTDQVDEVVDETGDVVTMTLGGVAEPQETNLLALRSPV